MIIEYGCTACGEKGYATVPPMSMKLGGGWAPFNGKCEHCNHEGEIAPNPNYIPEHREDEDALNLLRKAKNDKCKMCGKSAFSCRERTVHSFNRLPVKMVLCDVCNDHAVSFNGDIIERPELQGRTLPSTFKLVWIMLNKWSEGDPLRYVLEFILKRLERIETEERKVELKDNFLQQGSEAFTNRQTEFLDNEKKRRHEALSASQWATEVFKRVPENKQEKRGSYIGLKRNNTGRFDDISFREFQQISKERCLDWHSSANDRWTIADWSNAMAGECGEACNFVKKLRRLETGTPGNQGDDNKKEVLLKNIGLEIADTISYAVLLADALDIDVQSVLIEKFNSVSAKHGLPQTISNVVNPEKSDE